jgi:PD-(D/E)XK nuclease superfamily
VENIVLVELKVDRAIDDIHRAQCLNDLKATGLHLCLLLNFDGLRLEIKRMVRNFWGNIAAFACSACFAVPSSWDRCASPLEEPVASVEGINSNWPATGDGRYRTKERRASTGMSADMLVLLASYVIFY